MKVPVKVSCWFGTETQRRRKITANCL